jgi:NADH dehydrogenase [ubiquinone] 1 alpha subcomplex assembly factor 2
MDKGRKLRRQRSWLSWKRGVNVSSKILNYSKKKEEEEKKTGVRPVKTVGKFESPNLKSFIQQFPDTSLDQRKGHDEVSRSKDGTDTEDATIDTDRSSEPTGTGATFKPGTWQPPT